MRPRPARGTCAGRYLGSPARGRCVDLRRSTCLDDVHFRAISETREIRFAILPGETELTHIGEPEPARDVANRLEVPVVELFVRIAGSRDFEVSRDRTREKAIERLRQLRRPLPAGFTFQREEANER